MGLMLNSKTVGGAVFKSSSIAGMILGGKVIWSSTQFLASPVQLFQYKDTNTPWCITSALDGGMFIGDGNSDNTAGNLIRLDSTGTEVWTSALTGQSTAIASDTAGNVYAGDNNRKLTKFDSSGVQSWQWSSPYGNVVAMKTDADKTVYLGDDHYNVWELNSTEQEMNEWSSNGSIATIDKEFNVYTISYSQSTNKITVTKYSPDGNQIWANDISIAASCAGTDNALNSYLSSSSNTDKTVVKLDNNGSLVTQWSTQYATNVLAVDGSGNVYAGDVNGWVTKYDTNGNKAWRWGSPGNSVFSLAVDDQFNVYAGDNEGYVTKLQTVKQ